MNKASDMMNNGGGGGGGNHPDDSRRRQYQTAADRAIWDPIVAALMASRPTVQDLACLFAAPVPGMLERESYSVAITKVRREADGAEHLLITAAGGNVPDCRCPLGGLLGVAVTMAHDAFTAQTDSGCDLETLVHHELGAHYLNRATFVGSGWGGSLLLAAVHLFGFPRSQVRLVTAGAHPVLPPDLAAASGYDITTIRHIADPFAADRRRYRNTGRQIIGGLGAEPVDLSRASVVDRLGCRLLSPINWFSGRARSPRPWRYDFSPCAGGWDFSGIDGDGE